MGACDSKAEAKPVAAPAEPTPAPAPEPKPEVAKEKEEKKVTSAPPREGPPVIKFSDAAAKQQPTPPAKSKDLAKMRKSRMDKLAAKSKMTDPGITVFSEHVDTTTTEVGVLSHVP